MSNNYHYDKRLAVIHSDMVVTDKLLKRFRSKKSKEAIRKLRYLLILTQHKLKYGDNNDTF